MPSPPRQTWHITFGTYATRLHEDPRATVDRQHNQRQSPFPAPDPDRQQAPSDPPLRLTRKQCIHLENVFPQVCERGGWSLLACAAPFESPTPSEPRRIDAAHSRTNPSSIPIHGNHVHVLLDAPKDKQPKDIRKWLKRWLGESLTQTYGPPPKRWWAVGGSTKPVTDSQYRRNVIHYINRQRTTTPAT